MSAGKSRQSHCRRRNAAATSAVVRADVWCARGRSLGARFHFGAVPGCRAMQGLAQLPRFSRQNALLMQSFVFVSSLFLLYPGFRMPCFHRSHYFCWDLERGVDFAVDWFCCRPLSDAQHSTLCRRQNDSYNLMRA